MFDPVALLKALIAIPSVNPMGRGAAAAACYESRLTDFLQTQFDSLGLPWQRQTVAPLRDNIVARLDGHPLPDAGGELLLWEVHQDTVPTDGMTIDPFGAHIEGERIHGRGACDVKGGMAAMLAAIARLAEVQRRASHTERRPTVVLACTVDEELGFSGARALVQLWGRQENPPPEDRPTTTLPPLGHSRDILCDEKPNLEVTSPASLLVRQPDAAIVAEPTGLDVVVAHKGFVRWRSHTLGRAAHSAEPQRGRNAIYAMARLVEAVERYQNEMIPNMASHPRCGHPSVSIGTIVGGCGVNTVPDRATIEIDRRLLPDEDPEEAYRALMAYVNGVPSVGPVEHDPPFSAARGLSDHNNGPLAKRLVELTRHGHPACKTTGVSYGTDAAVFSAAGLPTVVFGPGSIEQAHTADEWLDLNELNAATEIFFQLGGGKR
jgi:acetylornithine deacetylase/succinyl-diaminopimelate desuccinylase-like protein